jgi:hypothetical protein
LKLREASVDQAGRRTARWRPRYSAPDWVELACAELGVERGNLAGRGRDPEVVRIGEVLGLVGIERFGVTVGELADELGKSRGGVTRRYRRGAVNRDDDPSFAATAAQLDYAASEEP